MPNQRPKKETHCLKCFKEMPKFNRSTWKCNECYYEGKRRRLQALNRPIPNVFDMFTIDQK